MFIDLRERERDYRLGASHMCPNRGSNAQPSRCPDQELHPQPLVYGMMLQPTEPPSQDWGRIFKALIFAPFLKRGFCPCSLNFFSGLLKINIFKIFLGRLNFFRKFCFPIIIKKPLVGIPRVRQPFFFFLIKR